MVAAEREANGTRRLWRRCTDATGDESVSWITTHESDRHAAPGGGQDVEERDDVEKRFPFCRGRYLLAACAARPLKTTGPVVSAANVGGGALAGV